MKSMTGFAYVEEKLAGMDAAIEIRSLNQRYKDILIKMPRRLSMMEAQIRDVCARTIGRGKVEVNIRVNFDETKTQSLSLNDSAVAEILRMQTHIKTTCSIPGKLDIKTLFTLPGVISIEQKECSACEQTDQQALLALVERALQILEESKEKEGETLKKDFLSRIHTLENLLSKIQTLSPALPEQYYAQLKASLEKYHLQQLPEERLLTELAIYAERINITEELVRFQSHLDLFRQTLSMQGPVGRKLDFILQEINREANTIASKSNSSEVSRLVVEMKSELEKIREQVQNIE